MIVPSVPVVPCETVPPRWAFLRIDRGVGTTGTDGTLLVQPWYEWGKDGFTWYVVGLLRTNRLFVDDWEVLS